MVQESDDCASIPRDARARRNVLRDIAGTFLRLGCISFGGPIAHIAYLRTEVVTTRKWVDDARYSDLVALCQFLPGPASSQLVFALGMQRAGVLGALVASACFTLPSALLMIGCAYGIANAGSLQNAGWLHGLKLAAAAVVAHAVWGMGKKLCTDGTRVALCASTAAFLLAVPGIYSQLVAMLMGALWGITRIHDLPQAAGTSSVSAHARTRKGAITALGAFASLLALLPLTVALTSSSALAVFDSFFRAGALVFGGGHVVLPLLRAEVAVHGWLADDAFIAGYGAAQALPGPLFAFAAYLGTAMQPGPAGWLNGLWCLAAIFLPAWLLVGGALPFWHHLRAHPRAQGALTGANAVVVGILLAALYHPIITESVASTADAATALLAFACLERWKAPPWLVVAGMAAAGQWGLPR